MHSRVIEGLRSINRWLWPHVLFFLSGFSPRNRRKVVFGAWLGWRFADNSKYLLLYLCRMGHELDLVWIGDETAAAAIPRDLPVRFVRRGSWAAVRETLTAGTCFVSHAMQDLTPYNLMRGARRVYLGHGVALKHMGARDCAVTNPFRRALRNLWRKSYRYDHYICCSPAHRGKLLVENATNGIVPGEILDCGQPRVDFLLHNADPAQHARFRHALLAQRGIPPVRRVISYLPTFRDNGRQPAFSFGTLDEHRRHRLDQLLSRLDAVLLEKSHVGDIQSKSGTTRAPSDRVFILSSDITLDTQELLLATDLLVTDYSGCYVDFLVLNRPVVHFAYDRGHYESADRGLYFNLDEVAGGPIVSDFDSLCHSVEGILTGTVQSTELQTRARTSLTEYERGDACAQIVRAVLPDVAADRRLGQLAPAAI